MCPTKVNFPSSCLLQTSNRRKAASMFSQAFRLTSKRMKVGCTSNFIGHAALFLFHRTRMAPTPPPPARWSPSPRPPPPTPPWPPPPPSPPSPPSPSQRARSDTCAGSWRTCTPRTTPGATSSSLRTCHTCSHSWTWCVRTNLKKTVFPLFASSNLFVGHFREAGRT